MVIESIINPVKAEKKPWVLFFIGFFYCSIALLLSLWVFERYASLVTVFLTVLALSPLFYFTIKYEEKKDILISSELSLLKEHWKAIEFLIFLFIGISLAITFWYTIIPDKYSQSLFGIQQQTITDINSQIAAKATGNAVSHFGIMMKILSNNIKVLLFTMIFALIYGIGAIFILTWNASVIGVAIGNFIKGQISHVASTIGLVSVSAYMQATSFGILRYFTHGLLEIAAYFIAGLAGGIISIAIIRKDFYSKNFEKILIDTLDMLVIAFAILIIAAFVEVYITPKIF